MAREPTHKNTMTEADTCREFVTPKLVESGWAATPCFIGEQHSFTNGRIIQVFPLLRLRSSMVSRQAERILDADQAVER